jgi:protein-disulfide isomerase
VRLVFRDFPLEIHPSAEVAAVASRCAAAQGKFWEMHARLFETHGVEWGGVPNRDRPVMLEFAKALQLDAAAFEQCQNDPAILQAVRDEAAAAGRIGVRSTPNFFVNGQLVIRGAAPFSDFQRRIEQNR